MPIKTKISVGTESEQLKRTLAAFERYRKSVEEAANTKTVSLAGNHLDSATAQQLFGLDVAVRSQSEFAAGSSKAARAFQGLHASITRLVERQAASIGGILPKFGALEGLGVLAGPIGLTVAALVGVGAAAAFAGIEAFRGLASGAAGVTDRRRFALGIGSGYGEVAGFDLDFARFGADQGTLSSVAGGLYDVTSPQRIGLMTAGVTGGKDAVATAVELIRKIPQMLKGVEGGAIGPVAKSLGLTDILDLPTIVRLKNHPEEIEDQVKKFQDDKITLDMSAQAATAWADFRAELDRDGLKIETVLGKSLVSLTPGLTHLSEEIVDVVGELIKSKALENGLKGAESGLERLGGYLGSDKFKTNEGQFLGALAALEQYAGKIGTIIKFAGFTDEVLNGILAAAQGNGAALRDWMIKKFGLDFLISGIAGIHTGSSTDAPALTGTGGYSIRYYAGHGSDRTPYGGVIDSATGKMLPRPSFRYSPGYGPQPGSPSDVVNEGGNVVIPAVTDQNRAYRNTGTITLPGADGKPHTYSFVTGGGGRGSAPTGTYDVGEFATGGAIGDRWTLTEVGQPHDTAFDPALNAERSALRIHMAHGDRTLGCIGILGGDKVFADFENNLMYVIKKNGGHVRLRLGSPDATSITNRMTPTSSGSAAVKNGALPAHPHSTGHIPIGAPLDLPGSAPPKNVGERLEYDRYGQHSRNAALRARGTHILDHMAPPPPKPVTIQDHSGGMVQFGLA
jgi:hypothetical protein